MRIDVIAGQHAGDNGSGKLETEGHIAPGCGKPALVAAWRTRLLLRSRKVCQHLARRTYRRVDVLVGVRQRDKGGLEL